MLDNIPADLGIFGIIIIVCLGLVARYLKSYIEEKAKSLAQKSDLEEITRIVEDVKSEYSKALTLLNANLSLASKGIESFEAEAFKAYVDFHSECSYIVNDLTNFGFSAFTDIKFLNDYKGLAESVQKRLGIAKGKVDLFNDQQEIKDVVRVLFLASIKYVSNLSAMLSQLSFSIEETAEHQKLWQEKSDFHNVEQSEESGIEMNELHQRLTSIQSDYEVLKQNTMDYINGDEFKEVALAMTEYEILIRKYIKETRLNMLK
jgi:hypothetical protein